MTDFGTDTLCLDSLQTGRLVDGVRLLGQRCYHRLITPRGMLRGGPDEGEFGIDLAGYVGRLATNEDERRIGPAITAELKKDPQVATVQTAVSSSTDSDGSKSWLITVAVASDAGPFELVLAVSGVTVELLNLGPTS